MNAEFFELVGQWAWVGWLVLIAVFLVVEMLTLEFTFLMLAVGSTVGLISGALGTPVWAQVIIAALAAVLLILLLRPPLLRRLRRNEDPTKSNIEAIIGLRGVAVLEVTEHSGQVKLSNGDIWTARSEREARIPQGAPIVIDQIIGATAVVRTASE